MQGTLPGARRRGRPHTAWMDKIKTWTGLPVEESVKAGVNRELLDSVKARKLAYCGHTMRKQRSCLEKEIMQGAILGAHRQRRSRTARMDDIKKWTGLPVEESIRITGER